MPESLMVESENLLANPDFENGTAGWIPWTSTLGTGADEPYDGDLYGVSSGRTEPWNGIGQQLAGIVQSGVSYRASGWVRVSSGDDDVHLSIAWNCEGDDTPLDTYDRLGTRRANSTGWSQVTGLMDVPDCEPLSNFILYFEGPVSELEVHVDGASLSELR